MNKELIIKLIERARGAAENAYCPYTDVAVGCGLLVEDNVIFVGCNIENGALSASAEAGEVAVFSAISQGYMKFRAICFWSSKRMPYPSGRVRQILAEFCAKDDVTMIIANDETYSLVSLGAIYPFAPEVGEIAE